MSEMIVSADNLPKYLFDMVGGATKVKVVKYGDEIKIIPIGEMADDNDRVSFRSLYGSFKPGEISSVDEFLANKHAEKELENF